jgi:hypothetical protein
MSEAAWAGFGFIMACAIWFALFSVSFSNWHELNKALKAEVRALEASVIHLEQIVHPEHWLDASDVAVNIAKKERLYDRHPDLVRPGSEVIDLTDAEEEAWNE